MKWSTLDGGCTDFSRVLKTKIEKMRTLTKNGDLNTEKGFAYHNSLVGLVMPNTETFISWPFIGRQSERTELVGALYLFQRF